jgi:hypothetical protein
VEEYLGRIKKLGSNDVVNGSTFNAVIEQLQHNIDLLYRSQASSVQNWNISELLFGNLLDYDQTGEKRFVNGGKLDSVEKILAFKSTVGAVSFEETSIMDNDAWLRFEVPPAISSNIQLIRNIVVPEALRHQSILLGFKIYATASNTAVIGERYEIYVNGEYSGTGETGITSINGKDSPKTIYGVYQLNGSESNLEVALVRSVTNGVTPSNYVVRVQNVLATLHSLSVSSFTLNYPTSGSSFIGMGADINSFYDFENNSIRVIPSFLITNEHLAGNSSLTVNITSMMPPVQSTYYIGLAGTGDQTGSNSSNMMSAATFFALPSFSTNQVNIYLNNDAYSDFMFDKASYVIAISSNADNVSVANVTAKNGANVIFNVTPSVSNSNLSLTNISVSEKALLKINSLGAKNVLLNNKSLSVDESGYVKFDVGTFSAPISSAVFSVNNGSVVDVTLANTALTNSSTTQGFGLSTGPLQVKNNSVVSLISKNSSLSYHIGVGDTSPSVDISNSSTLNISGFNMITTSSAVHSIAATKHSDIEILSPLQTISGATAFTSYTAKYYSSLGTVSDLSSLSGNVVSSVVYQIT